MFIVDGKLSRVRELADGRVAYWRGPDVPGAILTPPQLEEVQRLNGRRLLLPYGFMVFAVGLAFLSFKGQVPIAIPLLFGVLAILICTVSDLRARRRIDEILRRAPAEDRPPPQSSVASRFKAAWHGSGKFELRILTWFSGFVGLSSALGLTSKLTGVRDFDPNNEIHPLILLMMTVAALAVFHLCRKEVRRRRLLS